MNGQRIGYIRVSTLDQHIERQLDGLQVDKTFTDKASGKGVRIEFVKEHLTFTGEDSPMAKLMLSVMGAIHEFDRALIKERQRRGLPWPKSGVSSRDAKSCYLRRKLQKFTKRSPPG